MSVREIRWRHSCDAYSGQPFDHMKPAEHAPLSGLAGRPIITAGTVTRRQRMSPRRTGMKVESILKTKGRRVHTTLPITTVAQAIDEFSAANIGALVVSSDGEN